MAHIHSMPPTHYAHYHGTLQHALYTLIPTNFNLSVHTQTISISWFALTFSFWFCIACHHQLPANHHLLTLWFPPCNNARITSQYYSWTHPSNLTITTCTQNILIHLTALLIFYGCYIYHCVWTNIVYKIQEASTKVVQIILCSWLLIVFTQVWVGMHATLRWVSLAQG